jgi:hypothetical protein
MHGHWIESCERRSRGRHTRPRRRARIQRECCEPICSCCREPPVGAAEIGRQCGENAHQSTELRDAS